MIATNVAPSIAIAIFSRASISVAKTSLKKGEERQWKKDAFKSNVLKQFAQQRANPRLLHHDRDWVHTEEMIKTQEKVKDWLFLEVIGL